MTSPLAPTSVAEILLSWVNLELVSCTELQRLWAGYGHICAVEARNPRHMEHGSDPSSSETMRLILKLIVPPGQADGEGHFRKLLSYEVEQYFYENTTPHLASDVSVAQCLTSTLRCPDLAVAAGLRNVTATLMTDLRIEFPLAGEKRAFLSPKCVFAALQWLSNFHSTFWQAHTSGLEDFTLPPLDEMKKRKLNLARTSTRLWLNGGYTYLATRQSEFAQMADDNDSEWATAFCKQHSVFLSRCIADLVAEFLTPKGTAFETLIHGDVKSENLFSTQAGDKVAFFDFQYVGLGLGVCDLAKFFTCSVPLDMLTSSPVTTKKLAMDVNEELLLKKYLDAFLNYDARGVKNGKTYHWGTFKRHWECALVDWCRFQASWGFWGNTSWLQARVRDILDDQEWIKWLLQQLSHT